MKNSKLLSIGMMLVLSFSLSSSSCNPDPDPDPDQNTTNKGSITTNNVNSTTIDKYFAGEWFLVKEEESIVDTNTGESDNRIETWDYNNQTQSGSDGGQPEKIIINKVSENFYKVTGYHYSEYSNSWYESHYEAYNLNDNILEEYYDNSEQWKIYISELTSNKLVIISEGVEDEETYKEKYTYQRN